MEINFIYRSSLKKSKSSTCLRKSKSCTCHQHIGHNILKKSTCLRHYNNNNKTNNNNAPIFALNNTPGKGALIP